MHHFTCWILFIFRIHRARLCKGHEDSGSQLNVDLAQLVRHWPEDPGGVTKNKHLGVNNKSTQTKVLKQKQTSSRYQTEFNVSRYDFFRFSVNKEGNNYHGSFWLLVDETRYSRKDLYLGDGNETPSGFATINIELTAGQIVRVQNEGSSIVYGTNGAFTLHGTETGTGTGNGTGTIGDNGCGKISGPGAV